MSKTVCIILKISSHLAGIFGQNTPVMFNEQYDSPSQLNPGNMASLPPFPSPPPLPTHPHTQPPTQLKFEIFLLSADGSRSRRSVRSSFYQYQFTAPQAAERLAFPESVSSPRIGAAAGPINAVPGQTMRSRLSSPDLRSRASTSPPARESHGQALICTATQSPEKLGK